MEDLIDQFGGLIAGFGQHPAVRLVLAGAALYAVIVWLACALWVFQDARRRQASPAAAYLASLAVVLASPVLFVLPLAVYRIVRPADTLAAARVRQLESRLATAQEDYALACPGCRAGVDEAWLNCPSCRTRLTYTCLRCGRSMGLDWTACGWCGTDIAQPVPLDVTVAARPLPNTVEKAGFKAATPEAARA
jgi:hypothetical protein